MIFFLPFAVAVYAGEASEDTTRVSPDNDGE